MAIGYVGIGASAVGTTSIAPAYPSGLIAGDYIVMGVASKYTPNDPATPAGWTKLHASSAGSGAAGPGSGTATVTVFAKIATGAESGTETVAITSGNSACGRMFALRYQEGGSWAEPVVSSGSMTTAGTAVSILAGQDKNYRIEDFVCMFFAVNSNTYSFSGQSMSLPGVLWKAQAERSDSGTAAGDDCRLYITTHKVDQGTANGALTITSTASGSDTDAPAGPACFIRFREDSAPANAVSTIRRRKIVFMRVKGASRPKARPTPDMDDLLGPGISRRR